MYCWNDVTFMFVKLLWLLGNYCEVTILRNHGCEDDGVGIVDGECYGSPTCDDPFEHDSVESVVYKLQECRGIYIK